MAVPIAQAANGVRPVAGFEPSSLVGEWYEIAALPQFFQRECVRNVRLNFTQKSPDQLAMRQSCVVQDGGVESSEARMRPQQTDKSVDWARMQYSAIELAGEYRFWLARDYWVIERDPANHWVIIGQANRRGATVLSKRPALALPTLAEIIGRIKTHGYDACGLIVTPQLGGLSMRRSLCEVLP